MLAWRLAGHPDHRLGSAVLVVTPEIPNNVMHIIVRVEGIIRTE